MDNFHAVRNLLIHECFEKNQRMNEFAEALFFGFAVGQGLFSEIFVSEDEGSASAQLNQQSNLKFALKGNH